MQDRPVFDVRESPFRAVGDGQADDYPSLQQALDAANAAGAGVVRVPAGTYLLRSAHLQFASKPGGGRNITLEGDGAAKTKIVLGGPHFGCIYDGQPGLENIHVKNLTLDAGAFLNCEALVMDTSVKNVRIEHCVLRNCNNHRLLTIGSTVEQFRHHRRSSAVEVSDCRFELMNCGTLSSFNIIACDHAVIRRCVWDGYVGSQAALMIYGYVKDALVEDNTFLGARGGKDVTILQSADVKLRKNLHRHIDQTFAAFWIVNSVGVTIEDSIIEGVTLPGVRGSYGILVFDFNNPEFDANPARYLDSKQIVIRRNKINNTVSGIVIPMSDASADANRNQSDITIADNTFRGGSISPIIIGGPTAQNVSNVKIRNNRFESLPASLALRIGLIDVVGNPGFPPTSLGEDVGASPQAQTVVLTSAAGIQRGQLIDLDSGENLEIIEAIAVAGNQMRAIFSKSHHTGARIAPSARIHPGGGVTNVAIEANVIDAGGQRLPYAAIHLDVVRDVRIVGNDLRGTGAGVGAAIRLTRGADVRELHDNRVSVGLVKRE